MSALSFSAISSEIVTVVNHSGGIDITIKLRYAKIDSLPAGFRALILAALLMTIQMDDIGPVLLVGNVDDAPARAVKNEKFLRVIEPVAERTHLVAGRPPEGYHPDVDFSRVTHYLSPDGPLPAMVLNHLLVQLTLVYVLTRNRHEYDTVVLFMGYSGAALAGQLLGKDVVRFHGGPEFSGPWFQALALEVVPNRLADRILVPSPGCIEHFDLTDYHEKIETAHFHVDEQFRVETEFDDRPRRVGYFGHLIRSKGVDTLVAAVERANERLDEPLELVIGGTGPLAEELLLDAPHVTHRGWIDHDETPEVYNELRAFVLLSDSEGLPTVVLESLACGTPIVATPVGGVTDVITDSENGRLVKAKSPNAVADILVEVFESESLEEYHEHARETIDDTYRLHGVRERFRTVLSFD